MKAGPLFAGCVKSGVTPGGGERAGSRRIAGSFNIESEGDEAILGGGGGGGFQERRERFLQTVYSMNKMRKVFFRTVKKILRGDEIVCVCVSISIQPTQNADWTLEIIRVYERSRKEL